MSDANRNQLWGRVLMGELARNGVQHVVVAPGSRSTPLVLAAHASDELTVHTCLDERSAAFFALGIGRASGAPAAVVTTSGTAVANLLPAAVEADRAEVPLLLVTADRPRELRDGDANQSVRQPGMFSTCARAEWDLMHPEVSDDAVRHLRSVACRAVAAARGAGAGPVHLNVPLRKPLEPTEVQADRAAIAGLDAEVRDGRAGAGGRRPPWTVADRGFGAVVPGVVESFAEALQRAERPLVVFGHLQLGRLGHAGPAGLLAPLTGLGVPVLVDPLSGMRGCAGAGTTRISTYDTLLRDDVLATELRPDLILQFGRTPTSAVLTRWMAECGAQRFVVADGPLWKDHTATAHALLEITPEAYLGALTALGREAREAIRASTAPGWIEAWAAADAAASAELASPTSLELAVARTVVDATPEGAALFVSSSMPIRDVDTVANVSEREVRLFANRGASGIDGIVSSALGVAVGLSRHSAAGAASSRPRGVCLLGDLALLHDANGLGLAGEADVVFVVVDNDGGGIFHALPIESYDPPFTELFATPQGRDLGMHAAAFGVPHQVIGDAASASEGAASANEVAPALAVALAAALEAGGTRVIEVRTDRTTEMAARAADRARASEAARDAISKIDTARG